MEDPNFKYYPFDGYYVDLETLQRIEIDGILPTNFKSLSDYAFRFYAPENWINNFYKECSYLNSSFKIENDLSISIKDRSTNKTLTIENPDKGIDTDNVSGANFIFSTSSGIVEVKRLEGKNAYHIRKYNEYGKCKYDVAVEHTKIEITGNTHYHKPYLNYFTCTDKCLIFTSSDRNYPKTMQLNLIDGQKTEYNFSINGVIRTDKEENISSFICIDENKHNFKTIILNHSWTASPENLWANTAETVLVGNVLYIAFYHEISTGSSLYAYDLITGKALWQADVKQLNVSHSEYYNKVYLSSYHDKIIMEGIEAEGKYLQIFDAKSGKRLYSSI
jgi:hypothetical protein